MYRYDKSKKDVPYVYEIIEKVLFNFNKTIYMFNEEEKNIILKSLEKYDEILSDNRFCLIHNDLHFDNILLDAEGNKIN